jgi:DNA-directed RNA polymerase specialized sigma24 family protein
MHEAVMEPRGSVTRLLDQLRSDNPAVRDAAARQVWDRYSRRLLELARQRLDPRLRRREDEQDVVQSMYKSFCLRQHRGEFVLDSRDDLWQVLATITIRKSQNAARRHAQQCRDYHREQPSADAEDGPLPQWALEHMEGAEPTPEDAAVLNEEVERRLQVLPEDLRQVALWKLEGYSSEEIAGPGRLDCVPRTVQRKVERIRRIWQSSAELTDDPNTE